MMTDEFDFSDLTVREKPVTMPDKRKFILREAMEDAALRYRSASLTGMEMVTDDTTGDRTTRKMESVAEVEPLLVRLCLWDDSGRNPTPEYVGALPSRIIKPMFNWLKEVSDLGETEDVASLEKQVGKLQTRITRLKEKDADPKASGSGTTRVSG